MTVTRPKHSSGRPIRNEPYKTLPRWRIPNEGPVTPRLRQPWSVDAIGFVHSFSEVDDAEDDALQRS